MWWTRWRATVCTTCRSNMMTPDWAGWPAGAASRRVAAIPAKRMRKKKRIEPMRTRPRMTLRREIHPGPVEGGGKLEELEEITDEAARKARGPLYMESGDRAIGTGISAEKIVA